MAFGLTASAMHRWLKFSRHVLPHVLRDHPIARVCKPSGTETEQRVDATGVKRGLLQEERVWGAAERLKVMLQTAGTSSVQNKHCSRWTGGAHVDFVSLFAPDGLI